MNNLSPLPFYSSLEEQNHRRSYAFGAVYPLIVHKHYLMPFQMILPGSVNIVSVNVELLTLDGVSVITLSDSMKNAGLSATSFGEYTVVSFPANSPSLGLPLGSFCLNINGRYSEAFTVVSSTNSYLQLVWRGEEDIIYDGGRLLYDGNYANRVHLDTELGKPEYKFLEEGEERDGHFFAEKQISEKVFKFTFLAPEFLLDSLRVARMSDYVSVVDPLGRTYSCDSILFTPKWQTQGNLASVEAEFETSTVIKKLATGVDAGGPIGDYNIDYNEDYHI